ncbi:MAG: hypothetical protein COB12_12000 [Flavobacterium sp.]|nr:MAG: hypothetical protein COB12_12000 [Flavobacterium sp.]
MKIEIELPEIEGFEAADGKQPRPVKVGEYYVDMETLKEIKWEGACTSFDHSIILKKKAPKYKIMGTEDGIGVYVEIKVVEDILGVFDFVHVADLSPSCKDVIKNLKGLIK